MKLEVASAKKKEAHIVDNLLQLYLHDFSEFEPDEIGADGRFDYPYLQHYWDDPDRYPFLFRVDGHLAGFALLRFEADPLTGRHVMDMAEFFIMRRYRDKGVGEQAAVYLWDLFPGQWQVRVLKSNERALGFWRHIIARYTDDAFAEHRGEGALANAIEFTFRSRGNTDMPDEPGMDALDY